MTTDTREPTGEWFDGMVDWSRGQRLLLCMFGVCFLVLVASAPVTWMVLRPAKTSSSVPPPPWTGSAFASGDAMRQLEQHVKESSWVTFQLRGVFNETLLRLGALHSERVVLGRDGWMFIADTMRWRPTVLERTRERRRNIMRQALQAASAVGIRLLVVPIPDKSTIYPECTSGGRLDPGRSRLYDTILDDLSAAGVPHVDVRSRMLAYKEEHPESYLYHHRDSHFLLDGQLVTVAAIRQGLVDNGWIDLVVDEPTMAVGERRSRRFVPDLVRMLGLRCEAGEDGSASSVVGELMETTWWRPVYLEDKGGHRQLEPIQPSASVALCGTSFSQAMGIQLAAELRTRLDRRGVLGGGGSFGGIRRFVGEVGTDGFVPRILVWEFVERDYQSDWTVAQSLLE